jgi:hypothetical protein
MCAKCHQPVDSAVHVSDPMGTWIVVTHHGATERLADSGNDELPMLAFG